MSVTDTGVCRADFHRVRRGSFGALVLLSCCFPIAGCRPLDEPLCAKCNRECPDDLVCDPAIKRCVESIGDTCDIDSADADSSTGLLPSGSDEGDSTASGGAGMTAATSGSSSAPTGNGGAGGADDDPHPNTNGAPDGDSGSGGSGDSGSGDSSSTSAGGTSGRCEPESHGCIPRITTPTVLEPQCAGATIEIQLEAVCECDPLEGAHRSFHWVGSEVPGLSVSADGVLSGTPPAGVNEIDVTVFAEEGGVSSYETFTLSVEERCLVLFASEQESAGHPHVVASRLDDGTAQEVPRELGEAADVIAFDVSPDGRFLAQAEALDAEQRLSLFDLLGNEVRSVALEATGDYRAHAFSPDSRWLALVTADPVEPLDRSLHLIDLSVDPPQLLDSTDSAYLAGLTWADNERLLLVGEMSVYSYYAVAKEFWVESGGWAAPIEYLETHNILEVDPFGGLFVNRKGFFLLYSIANCFWSYADGQCWEFLNIGMVSPNIEWGLAYIGEGARIDPLGDFVAATPYSSVAGCASVLAWSEDGATLLCHQEPQPIVYQVGAAGSLSGTELDVSEAVPGPPRAAFSGSGAWLAFTPTDDGLVIVPEASFATASLDDTTLTRPQGDNKWDFFFTADEKMLVVQRGQSLVLVHLPDPGGELRFSTVQRGTGTGTGDVVLPAVPDCDSVGLPDLELWCGAPRFRGNFVTSHDDAYLGFPDAEGVVNTVDLRGGVYQALSHGTLAPGCAGRCIQFR